MVFLRFFLEASVDVPAEVFSLYGGRGRGRGRSHRSDFSPLSFPFLFYVDTSSRLGEVIHLVVAFS